MAGAVLAIAALSLATISIASRYNRSSYFTPAARQPAGYYTIPRRIDPLTKLNTGLYRNEDKTSSIKGTPQGIVASNKLRAMEGDRVAQMRIAQLKWFQGLPLSGDYTYNRGVAFQPYEINVEYNNFI